MPSIRSRDLLLALLLGTGLLLVSYYSQIELLEYRLWQGVDIVVMDSVPAVTLFGLIHAILGLSLFLPSFYHVIEVVRVNRGAQAGKNQPISLLRHGYYASRRHPMTGMFMSIVAGLFVSLCSFIGLILVVLLMAFFHVATLYEERTWLLPRFGTQYKDYMSEVPRRYFRTHHLAYLVAVLAFTSVGIVF